MPTDWPESVPPPHVLAMALAEPQHTVVALCDMFQVRPSCLARLAEHP